MRWFVFALFLSVPLLGLFAAWQGRALLTGRSALLTKRLSHLPPIEQKRAQREFGYLCSAAAVSLIALPVLALAFGWNYSVWGYVFQAIGGVMVVWGWVLGRRHKLHSK